MKRKDIKELYQKEEKELGDLLLKLRKELVRIKMEIAMGKVKNLRQPARIKDDIARVKTVLNQKRI